MFSSMKLKLVGSGCSAETIQVEMTRIRNLKSKSIIEYEVEEKMKPHNLGLKIYPKTTKQVAAMTT